MASKQDILRWKRNSEAKLHLPFKAVSNTYQDIKTAEKELCHLEMSNRTRWMVQKGYVIMMVSAVEVYFRDMFDFMIKQSLKYGHTVKLQGLHKKRYDVDEIHSHIQDEISPYELVVNSVNFQNYKAIEEAYAHLLSKSLWKGAKAIKIKRKEGKDFSIDDRHLGSFRRLLKLRHELIHQSFHADSGISQSDKDGIIDTLFVLKAADEFLIQHFLLHILRDISTKQYKRKKGAKSTKPPN